MTTVSIVTVCFNCEATIERTVQSVLEQTHPNIEYIVVDGASRDRTMDIVRGFGERIHKVISEPDRGIYDAMNKGWQAASGDVVGFLNSDDVLAHPDVVASIAATFVAREQLQAVYGDIDLVDEDGRTVRRWRSGRFSKRKYHWGWMTPHPTTYIRRDLFQRFGGFRTELRIAADYELMLRFFVREGAKVGYIPRTVVQMRAGGASNGSLRAVLKANLEVYSSWKLNGLRTSPAIVLLKPFSKVFQLQTRLGRLGAI